MEVNNRLVWPEKSDATTDCCRTRHVNIAYCAAAVTVTLLFRSMYFPYKNPQQTQKTSQNKKVIINQICMTIGLNAFNASYHTGAWDYYSFQKFLSLQNIWKAGNGDLKWKSIAGIQWDLKLQVLHMDDVALSQSLKSQGTYSQWFDIWI